jgi:septum formation protein
MIPERWVLASASPRRRALITLLGHPVEILPVEIDESPQPGEGPPACAARLARAKVEAARLQAPEALILAADTVVDLEGQILGKPADAEEARGMLRALRGRAHLVHTAVAVDHPPWGETRVEVATARVIMRAYADEEIEAYLATGDPFDIGLSSFSECRATACSCPTYPGAEGDHLPRNLEGPASHHSGRA